VARLTRRSADSFATRRRTAISVVAAAGTDHDGDSQLGSFSRCNDAGERASATRGAISNSRCLRRLDKLGELAALRRHAAVQTSGLSAARTRLFLRLRYQAATLNACRGRARGATGARDGVLSLHFERETSRSAFVGGSGSEQKATVNSRELFSRCGDIAAGPNTNRTRHPAAVALRRATARRTSRVLGHDRLETSTTLST